jgi:Lrp/AsnC family leucine-responsive transcriptional regulator
MRLLAKDIALLHELYINGRSPFSELGKNIGVAKENVAYRLSTLKQNKVIIRIIPLLDYSRMGYRTFRILMKGSYTPEGFKKLVDLTALHWFANLSGGSWNITATFLVKDEIDFYDQLPQIFECFDDVQKYSIAEIIAIEHFSPGFLTTKEKVHHITGRQEPLVVDQTEEKILSLLFQDGRMSVLDIAKKMNMSATAITYHIKKLVTEKVIISYVPVISPKEIGYDHFKIMFKITKPFLRSMLYELLKEHPNVIYITHSLGSYDLECEVLFEHISDVTKFCDDINKKVPLLSYEFIITDKVVVHHEIV